MEEIKAVFTFIRHGATAGNLEKRYIGRKTDESLCEDGILKIMKNKAEGKYPRADFVFSSPMRRCIETCGLIYGAEKKPEFPDFPEFSPVLIEEFCETDFGCFEGKNYAELKENTLYKKWLESGGALPFPGGESREDFSLRSIQGFSRMLSLLGENLEKEILVSAVVHGGTVMAVLSKLTGKNYYDFYIENGEALSFRLKISGGKTVAEILP